MPRLNDLNLANIPACAISGAIGLRSVPCRRHLNKIVVPSATFRDTPDNQD